MFCIGSGAVGDSAPEREPDARRQADRFGIQKVKLPTMPLHDILHDCKAEAKAAIQPP